MGDRQKSLPVVSKRALVQMLSFLFGEEEINLKFCVCHKGDGRMMISRCKDDILRELGMGDVLKGKIKKVCR